MALAASKTIDKKAVQSKAWSVVREALTLDDSAVREQAVQSLEFVDNPPGDQCAALSFAGR